MEVDRYSMDELLKEIDQVRNCELIKSQTVARSPKVNIKDIIKKN